MLPAPRSSHAGPHASEFIRHLLQRQHQFCRPAASSVDCIAMASRPNRAESKRLQKQISDSSDSSAGQSLVSDTPPGGVQWGSIANTNGVRELVPARSSTLPGDSDGGSPDPTDSTFALLPRDVDPASCPQSVDVEVDVISETTLEDDGVSQHVKEKSRICRAFSSLFLCTLTRREKLIVMSIAIVNLTSQMCLSIMAPFFPIEVPVMSCLRKQLVG